MLIRRAVLEGIRDGAITLAFRRWRRPGVRNGGTLATAIGILAIEEVAAIDEGAITLADARQAGYSDLAGLHRDLAKRPGGQVYRVRMRYLGEDPRQALRLRDRPGPEEMRQVLAKLRRMDGTAARGAQPWVRASLELIAARPARPAGTLAATLGRDKAGFKRAVARLKAPGLTESLQTGYRLSPRGRAVLAQMDDAPKPD